LPARLGGRGRARRVPPGQRDGAQGPLDSLARVKAGPASRSVRVGRPRAQPPAAIAGWRFGPSGEFSPAREGRAGKFRGLFRNEMARHGLSPSAALQSFPRIAPFPSVGLEERAFSRGVGEAFPPEPVRRLAFGGKASPFPRTTARSPGPLGQRAIRRPAKIKIPLSKRAGPKTGRSTRRIVRAKGQG